MITRGIFFNLIDNGEYNTAGERAFSEIDRLTAELDAARELLDRRVEIVASQELISARGELAYLLEACKALLPYLHDDRMEGETDYEKRVLALEDRIVKAEGAK